MNPLALSRPLLRTLILGACAVVASGSAAKSKKTPTAQGGQRTLIFNALEPDAAPMVLVNDDAPIKIDAPVFYVTIGSEGQGGRHTGRVEVQERTMMLEPGKTKKPDSTPSP